MCRVISHAEDGGSGISNDIGGRDRNCGVGIVMTPYKRSEGFDVSSAFDRTKRVMFPLGEVK